MKKILLIDDSSFSRNVIKRALGEGYIFIEAENGLAGIELFSQQKPDLVVLDLTMPGMSGLEVLEQLRQIDSKVPIMIGSADIQRFTQDEAASLGADGFIPKPFTPEMLHAALQPVLKGTVWTE